MAEIPLRLVSWVYDDETNRVEAKFEDIPGPDDPNPVAHRPTKFFTIEILPQTVHAEEREPQPIQLDSVASPAQLESEPETPQVPTPPVPPAPEEE